MVRRIADAKDDPIDGVDEQVDDLCDDELPVEFEVSSRTLHQTNVHDERTCRQDYN